MRELIPTPNANASEVGELRTRHGKAFDFPDRSRKIINRVGFAHWWDGTAWQDINTDWVNRGGVMTVDTAPFVLEWLGGGRVGFRYRSRSGGDLEVELTHVGGVAVGLLPIQLNPQTAEGDMILPNLLADLDLVVRVRPKGVMIWKRLKSALAPRVFTFALREREAGPVRSGPAFRMGYDNADDVPIPFSERLVLERQRPLEVLFTESPKVPVAGALQWTMVEEWTGRVEKIINRATRERAWSAAAADIVYPVAMDPDITENIVSEGDDGHEISATWTGAPGNTLITGRQNASFIYYGGWRFQTVNVAQGASISLAELVLDVETAPFANDSIQRCYADDVDDAPVWSDTSRPLSGFTKTTAFTEVTFAGTTTGQKRIEVTQVVQEIVDRVGWAANNDIRFALFNQVATDYSQKYIDDYGFETPGVLEITVAAPPGPPADTIPAGVIAGSIRW